MKSTTTPDRDVGSSDSSAWVRTADQLPPNKIEVETKLDDALLGVRNVQTLKRSGNLWLFPDMSMYVYYHPTHWRSLPNTKGSRAEERE